MSAVDRDGCDLANVRRKVIISGGGEGAAPHELTTGFGKKPESRARNDCAPQFGGALGLTFWIDERGWNRTEVRVT